MKRLTKSWAARVPASPLPLVVALALAAPAPAAMAAEFDAGDGKLKVTGTMTFGWMGRTDDQDPSILFNPNAILVGKTGTASGGKNADDGNLNYDKGDTVSTVAKAYVTLDYKWREYGFLGSVKAWYDFFLLDFNAPWGNLPNNLTAGAHLGTGGALPLAKFSGIVSDNLYLYGNNRVGDVPVDWKVGYQKLDWGNRFVVVGGLRDLNAIDLPGSLRPGAIPIDETRVAAPMVFAGVNPAKGWRIEGFWQFHYQRNIPLLCGTFYSQSDYIAEGCDKALTGQANDRVSLATGSYFKRGPTVTPDNLDEGGAAVKYTHAPWATEFGAYVAQFDSRSSFWNAVKSGRTAGPPFIPGDPGGLNPSYYVLYPESIRMFAVGFETKWSGGGMIGEFSYRPNQPLQYNAADVIAAAASNTAPTPLRAAYSQVAPGAVFQSYEEHHNVQVQLGASQGIPAVLGAGVLNVGAEVVYKGVPDLPSPSVTRFGRSDLFGSGPVNGVCVVNTPVACTDDGFVSKHAWGVRARAVLRYPNVWQGVELVPSVSYGYDIKGWSGDGGILEGRNIATVSLRANMANGLTGEIAWWPTWGGTYNVMRDRGSAQASIGYRF